jgi:hypothetical protein
MLFFIFFCVVGDRVGKVHNGTLQGTLLWFSFLTFVNDNCESMPLSIKVSRPHTILLRRHACLVGWARRTMIPYSVPYTV